MNSADAKPEKALPSYPPPGLPASVRNVLLEAANDTEEASAPASRSTIEQVVESRIMRKTRKLASKAPAKPEADSRAQTKNALEERFREELNAPSSNGSAAVSVARKAAPPPIPSLRGKRPRRASVPPPPPPLPESLRRALQRPDLPPLSLLDLESRESSESDEGSLLSMAPRVDVYENDRSILILADVPGVGESDISLEVEGVTMTLAAVRDTSLDLGSNARTRGAATPNYKRSFTIPRGVELENIDATLHDGVLRISVPKVAPPATRIAVDRNSR